MMYCSMFRRFRGIFSENFSAYSCRTMASQGADPRADRLKFIGRNVWIDIRELEAKHNPVNLGIGKPDWPTPQFIKDSFIGAINDDFNQYTRSEGHPDLVKALSETFSPLLNREINPLTEVLVTCGAAQSLYNACGAFINPGDEAILIEPYFDFYYAGIKLFDGVPVGVPLRYHRPTDGSQPTSANFKLDFEELESKINEKTRLLFLNTPNNPTGKVFSLEELEKIASIVQKHPRLIVISDEVYERLVFSGSTHIRFASLPGMWDRTITIGSAGKTFNVTGWKIGWSLAPAPLIKSMWFVHSIHTYAISTPTQEAVARSFRQAPKEEYFEKTTKDVESKMLRFVELFKNTKLVPIVSQGSYFFLLDASALSVPESDSKESRGFAAMRYMIETIGVSILLCDGFFT
eukprot:TRINITY_DN704_c0_g1_i3.p1 TRINITY_DN704_c0_g1~~TRINITY_DN704_c0_g1_i3.p1  ORF type:complete len:405 (-),score=59.12 TRINITY_DN704_c0_g1_i3:419-1633(-)